MDRRNQTRREVLLERRDEAIASFDELVELCHRALSAHLWTTCCWPKRGANWKIGDFNFLVVSVEPDPDASLYVQFWSEPGSSVLSELGSGEWNPGAIRYIGPTQRSALAARGYELGGRAQNYQKTLVIDSAAAAEAVALDVLQTFFEVFGYRGQWRLEIRRHRGERAESKAVYSSLTPQDFATAASHAGFEATVKETDSPPFVALTHGRRRFVAFMESRVSGQNLYSLIALQAQLTLNRPVTDEAIARANMAQQFVKVWRTDKHSVRLHMPLALDGGVTTAWLTQSLRHWIGSWRVCERQLRRGDTEATGLILQGTELVQ